MARIAPVTYDWDGSEETERGQRPSRAVRKRRVWTQPGAGSDWSSTSIVDSRSGFASALPEFDGGVAPEVSDPAAMFLAFAPGATSGTIKLGAPVYLECALTGTFAGGTLAATGSVGGFAFTVAATVSSGVLTGTVTITNGTHEEVRLFNAYPGADAVTIPAGLWADAVNGDDGSDGTSPDEAVQTIDGLPVLSAGDRVYLARGSHWRELLDTSGAAACKAIAYGIGPRPILDATEFVQAAQWTKTGGRTNIYQCTITGENPGGTGFSVIVLQEGWQLEPLADQAAVDAAAGTYVAQSLVSGGPVTIYANLYGASKVPVDNQVEISIRPVGYKAIGAAHAVGLMCRAGWSTRSGIEISHSGATTDAAYVDDCVCLHANDHHLWLPGGELRRTVLVGCNRGANTAASIVVYRDTIDPSDSFSLYELACLQFPQLANANSYDAYVAHSGVSGDWLNCTITRCYSYGLRGWAVHHGVLDECLFEECRGTGPVIGVITVNGILTVQNTRILGKTGGGISSIATFNNGSAAHPSGGVLTLENVVSWFPGDTLAGGHIVARGGNCVITNCHFSATATDFWDDNTNAAQMSVSRTSCPRGSRVSVSGSLITAVDYVACLAASNWDESLAATARAWSPDFVGSFPVANFSTTLPVYETEANPNRPIFLETSASVAARGWDIGPEQTRPGSGVSWVTPEVGSAWRTFIDGLSGPPS